MIQPEESLSRGNSFRSPFDPRSEEDLVTGTHGEIEEECIPITGRYRYGRRLWLKCEANPTPSSDRTSVGHQTSNSMYSPDLFNPIICTFSEIAS